VRPHDVSGEAVVVDCRNELGETPIWDEATGPDPNPPAGALFALDAGVPGPPHAG
jgi:hypothetical protein